MKRVKAVYVALFHRVKCVKDFYVALFHKVKRVKYDFFFVEKVPKY